MPIFLSSKEQQEFNYQFKLRCTNKVDSLLTEISSSKYYNCIEYRKIYPLLEKYSNIISRGLSNGNFIEYL